MTFVTAQGLLSLYLFLCPNFGLRSALARFSDAQRVCHFRDQDGCKGIIIAYSYSIRAAISCVFIVHKTEYLV